MTQRDDDRNHQAELLLNERLSTIGRMAALLAHEIRTPLTSIGGFARRLVRNTPPDDPRLEELEIIVAEVMRLERLVDEVLGYARITSAAFVPTDINREIDKLLVALHEELVQRGIRVEMFAARDLPPAEVDPTQLGQALTNLIVNAMEAMPGGGTLTISTLLDGQYVELAVADSGVGIPPENRDKLFTPFFTTKDVGTGLGLPVVAQVVANHGGSIRFESDPGMGTTFSVRFPIRRVSPA